MGIGLLRIIKMLKKKLGIEAIERSWILKCYFKISSTLTIPEGCVKIGGFTFCNCERLREVIIPEGVVKIGINV